VSAEALTWAFRQNSLKPAERFVLVVLADRANQEGVCWPGYKDIAFRTGYTERRVQQLVGALVRTGLVEKSARTGQRGRQTSNLYILRFERGVGFSEIGRRVHRVAEYNASLPRSDEDCGQPCGQPEKSEEFQGRKFQGRKKSHPPESSSGAGDIPDPAESRISPLESSLNQHPVATTETLGTGRSVDNNKEAPSLAPTSMSAPPRAEEVRHDGQAARMALEHAKGLLGYAGRRGGDS